jgi:DNA-binding winged helix-turn-helix (wHTH) protein
LQFGPFTVDFDSQRLWRDGEPLHFAPKSLAVLLHLIRERPRIVTKDELLDTVWPDVHVGDAVLKVTIREIRRLLGDDAKQARYVETAHRRGYRFVSPAAYGSSPGPADVSEPSNPASGNPPSTTRGYPLVGRDAPLARIEGAFERAMAGQRQIVFVSGEAGLGKTSAIEAFLAGVERTDRAAVSRGQCVEQASVPEPYLAVLDAFSRLLKRRHRTEVEAALRRCAPTWVAQLPGLAATAGDSLKQDTLGATPGRMLREVAEALEDLTRNLALVLFVDDLHWTDEATVDFVSLIARRSEPARLMLVLAYRPSELAAGSSALKMVRQELLAKGLAQDVPLEFLTVDDVKVYLDTRFAGHALPGGFAAFVHDHTEGHPLFITHLLDHFQTQGVIDRPGGQWTLTRTLDDITGVVPESLRQLIDATVDRLLEDQQRVLEAASVCGAEFSAAAVAAALDGDQPRTELWLDKLVARGPFIRAVGSDRLPDGTWSPRYAFTHAIFQHVLYQRLPLVGRMRLHLKIADRGEMVYGSAVDRLATELALHFERGAEHRKAIKYLRMASANAVGRFANREAARCLERALTLTGAIEEGDRWETELLLLDELGHVRRRMGDMRGAGEAFLSSATLAESHDRPGQMVESLVLAASALSWFDRSACLAVADRAEAHARSLDAGFQQDVRSYAAYWRLLWNGWRAEDARDLWAPVTSVLARESRHGASMFWRHAFGRLLGSDYEGSRCAAREGADLARRRGDAFGLLVAQFYRVWASLLGGAWGEAERTCDESLHDARRNEHRQWETLFQAMRAWLLREAGDPDAAAAVARQGLADARSAQFAFGELLAGLQLGLACLECGRFGDARAELEQLDRRLAHERLLMDWSWRMPLDLGLAGLALVEGRLDDARTRATAVCGAASQSGEKSWLALGSLTLAETQAAAGAMDASHAALSTACDLAGSGQVPAAALRVWARASRLAGLQGDAPGAARFQIELERHAASLVRTFAADSPVARRLADANHVRLATTVLPYSR